MCRRLSGKGRLREMWSQVSVIQRLVLLVCSVSARLPLRQIRGGDVIWQGKVIPRAVASACVPDAIQGVATALQDTVSGAT